MKNIKSIFIFTSVTIFTLFGTLVPLRPTCGCITQESFVLGSVNQVKTTINLYYDEYGEYPSLEILKTQLSNKITASLVARVSDPENQGIYYSTTDDRKTYQLTAYAEKETLFGIKILVKVFDNR